MSNFHDPLKIARGNGSAHTGVHHFMIQRLTALALVGLSIWFLVFVLSLLHANFAQARASLAEPVHALAMIAFLGAMFWHAQLGLQVIIEDYVHSNVWQFTLQIALKFLCVAAAIVSIFAVLQIALGS